jgi:hypothetical protein
MILISFFSFQFEKIKIKIKKKITLAITHHASLNFGWYLTKEMCVFVLVYLCLWERWPDLATRWLCVYAKEVLMRWDRSDSSLSSSSAILDSRGIGHHSVWTAQASLIPNQSQSSFGGGWGEEKKNKSIRNKAGGLRRGSIKRPAFKKK